jgi:glyoxylase-like metal-dependent hydrolase (beta-lactamase superfamily II)
MPTKTNPKENLTVIQFNPENDSNIEFASNSHLIKIKKNNKTLAILLDAGSTNEIENYKFDYLILTHFHYDHIISIEKLTTIKPKLDIYLSQAEIDSFKISKINTILNYEEVNIITKLLKENKIKLKPIKEIKDKLEEFDIKVLYTPGHTKGSICLLYKDILFSGDTLFKEGFGRIDLPTSVPKEMENSLKMLKKQKIKTIYCGHSV